MPAPAPSIADIITRSLSYVRGTTPVPAPSPSIADIITARMNARLAEWAAYNEAANRLGRRVVQNYEKDGNKFPGGACFEVCYKRVLVAAKQEGVPLPALDPQSQFGMLWGSYVHQKLWRVLPDEYKGKGAAGAMAYARLGTLVESADIWAGKLLPGAVIQVWWTAAGFEEVRAGRPALGHSFLFLSYVSTNGVVTGMNIADQGYQGKRPLPRSAWGYWVGANHLSGDPPFIY